MALNINGTTGISGVDGSASAPALQGTDSNTGINFASDTVNINTGGTTRATVDSSGKFLVGLTSGLSSQDGSIQAAGPVISKGFINDHTTNAAVLQYQSNIASIRAYGATAGSGILAFQTGGGGGSTDGERLRIGASGQIGIGGANYGSSGQVLTSQGSGSAVQWAAVPAGGITQSDVVSVTKTNTFTTSSSSFVDIGLSVTITPTSSSSKILVLFGIFGSNSSSGSRWAVRMVRGSTAIAIGDAVGNRARVTGSSETAGGGGNMKCFSGNHLDSPSTTSATTYKFQAAAIDGNTVKINASVADSDISSYPRTASYLTVIEVKP